MGRTESGSAILVPRHERVDGMTGEGRIPLPAIIETKLNCQGLEPDVCLRPDGGAVRQGAQYDGNPALGTCSLRWDDTVPKWGRAMKRGFPGGIGE